MNRLILCCVVSWLGCSLSPAQAHKASDAYANIERTEGQSTVSFSLALKDLDIAMPELDADNDRALTWGELNEAMPQVLQRVAADSSWLCGAEPIQPDWRFKALERRSDGTYLRIAADMRCAQGQSLQLDYRFLQGLDPTHRLIIAGKVDARPIAMVLSERQRSASIAPQPASAADKGALPNAWAAMKAFFLEGVDHILSGYDHLAFLLALLLPIRLRRSLQVPATGVLTQRPALTSLIATVTAFTLGHSVTLVLATLGVIAPPDWVEPAILVSIVIAALLNLRPVRGLNPHFLALGFGLVHGMGFSGVMREAGVTEALLPWALAGFNLGVEAGQLCCVALWCALNLLIGAWAHYQRVVIQGGSTALCLLALFWLLPMLG